MQVDNRAFSTILEDITRLYFKVPQASYLREGRFPIIDQSQSFIGGYTDEENLVVDAGQPVIVFGDHTKIVKYVDFPFAIGADGVKVLRVNGANPGYIYQYLKTVKLPNAGYSRHFKFLKEIVIPVLHSQIDQVKTADILFKIETLIQFRQRGAGLLNEFISSVFENMFDSSTFESDFLGNLIDIQSGQVNPSESPYNEMYHVGGANIVSETGELVNLRLAKDENLVSGKYLFTKDHILYSKIRPNLNKVAAPKFTGICSADIYPLKPKNEQLLKEYLLFVLRSSDFLSYAQKFSDRANIPKINRDALVNYRIPLPPYDLQKRFASIIMHCDNINSGYKDSLTELENLYGSLSQRAFKGELDLSKVPVSPFEVDGKSWPEPGGRGYGDPFEGIEGLPEDGRIFGAEDFKKLTDTGKWKNVTNENFGGKEEAFDNAGLENKNDLKDNEAKRDISKMSLDEWYGIPDEIVEKYGSIENVRVDLEFFMRKYFGEKVVTAKEVAEVFDKAHYESGQYFEYSWFRKFIMAEMKKEPSMFKQYFNDQTKAIELVLDETTKV